jgi:hypothetical protein
MAATLLEIKSKSILPKIEEIPEDDPETLLIRQLEEYKLFKEVSAKLKDQENVERFYKEPDKTVGDVKIVYNDFNLEGLISAFSKLLMRVDDKKRQENVLKEIPKEVFTVRDKIEHIKVSERRYAHLECALEAEKKPKEEKPKAKYERFETKLLCPECMEGQVILIRNMDTGKGFFRCTNNDCDWDGGPYSQPLKQLKHITYCKEPGCKGINYHTEGKFGPYKACTWFSKTGCRPKKKR